MPYTTPSQGCRDFGLRRDAVTTEVHHHGARTVLVGYRYVTHQLHIFGVGQHSGAEIDAAVHDALLLLLLEDAGDYGLRRDAVAAVVHHHGSQRVQPGRVHGTVHSHALQVVALQVK